MLIGTRRALLGGQKLPPFDFDPALVTFTPGAAEREGPDAVWAAVVAVQGKPDCTGTGDVVSALRGAQISGHWYAQFDGYQWELVTRWIPEFSHDVGSGKGYLFYASANHYVAYDWDNNRFELCVGGQTMTVSHNATAGTAISLVAGGSSIGKYDATNYGRVSIDNAQTFGITTPPTASAPGASIYLGSNNGANVASGLYGGPTVIRELAWDGTYGTDMGQGDIVAAHAAGADVCLSIGSWGVTCCVPTNATPGALVTGEGEAWSHPHGDALLTDSFCQTTYGSSAWGDEGTPSAGPADQAAATKIFPWGYDWTCGAADDGITQTIACDEGQDFVIRGIAHCTSADDIRVRIWDETNGEQMRKTADFDFGASSSRTQPGVAHFTFRAATSALTGSAADCVSFSVKVMGTANTQVVYCHQVELQDNLLINPSMATGAGNPWIPDGWTSANLDAGDTQASSTGGALIHSGSEAMQWNVGATAGEYMWSPTTMVVDGFFGLGGWLYGDGTHGLQMGGRDAGSVLSQTGASSRTDETIAAAWSHITNVVRCLSLDYDHTIVLNYLHASPGYADDVYLIPLTAVSLTATPATAENSAETSGLRVDGLDTCTQTIANLKATKGRIRWKWTPRHDAADAVKYGESAPAVLHAYGDADDYIYLEWTSGNTMRLRYNAGGAGEQTANWDATGAIVAGTTYGMEVNYTGSKMELKVDGVVKTTITAAVAFSTVPATLYWGSVQAGGSEADGTYAAP